MQILPFTLEHFFARYEFTTPYLLCASDCETLSVAELLALGDHSLEKLGALRLGYTEAPGSPALRTAVARQYQQVSPEEVIILSAPEEGIYLTMRALLEPGDHVIVLTPAYNSLLNMAQHVSGNVSEWVVGPGNGRWHLDLARLEELIRPSTRLIIVNFPHNPTGLLPTRDELQTIIEIAERAGAWIFCDEMYRGLELGGRETLPSMADLYPRSIVLSGLSKVHGLPGLRSGWLLCHDTALRDSLMNWKFYTSICPPAPSEQLALAALDAQDALVARSRDIIERNLRIADAFFARWPDLFNWRSPQASPVALVTLHRPSVTHFCHQLAQEAGVLLLPSTQFSYGDAHVRMGFGRLNFPEALTRFEQYLRTAG